MATKSLQPWAKGAWDLTRRQHGVVTRRQLLDLGMPPTAIRTRLEGGQLHRLWTGVYAVGLIDVAVPATVDRRRRGISLHRRAQPGPTRIVRGIPVADPISVLVDLAVELDVDEVEAAVNEADRLDLILDAQTFSRAQNALERRFLALVREAGLPGPTTQRRLGRHRVDFFWPDLGFVVETDSLRHHRTAAEQATDIGRDQAHVRAGLRALRFTHSQVFYRPDHVCAVLKDTFDHLAGPSTGRGVSIA